jgi:hypothetical protein
MTPKKKYSGILSVFGEDDHHASMRRSFSPFEHSGFFRASSFVLRHSVHQLHLSLSAIAVRFPSET